MLSEVYSKRSGMRVSQRKPYRVRGGGSVKVGEKRSSVGWLISVEVCGCARVVEGGGALWRAVCWKIALKSHHPLLGFGKYLIALFMGQGSVVAEARNLEGEGAVH